MQKNIVYFRFSVVTFRLLLLKTKELENQWSACLTVVRDICCIYPFKEISRRRFIGLNMSVLVSSSFGLCGTSDA